jgi:hypothetical protein
MDKGLFEISEAFLLAIMRLQDSGNVDFKIVTDHIGLVSDSLTEIGLHSFPDFRVNFAERLNFTRGFAAALDVLKNIFRDPEHLVVEFREQEEISKAMQQGIISDEGGHEDEG